MKQAAAANFVFIEPMKALVVRDLPAGDWLYEMKFNGYRALALKTAEDLRLISRNGINFGDDYPQLIDALKSLSVKQAIIDGEIAALDDEGKSSFQLLQSYGKAKQTPLVYFNSLVGRERQGKFNIGGNPSEALLPRAN
jgi:bifunctional non-homologous end joining protein LigD